MKLLTGTEKMRTVFLMLLFMLLIVSGSAFPQEKELFKTGQQADIILGAFANSASAKEFNLPSRVMTDGQRLFVADPRNNRILIWNTIPENHKKRPDVVVGQPDFKSNFSGSRGNQLNFPLGVYSDGERLFVADTYNDRILIWNEIPTGNGQSADIVLGHAELDSLSQSVLNASAVRWPWDVCFDGKRLYVASTGAGRVSVWNGLPEKNNQEADFVLGKADFISSNSTDERALMMSPSTVASDGTRLVVGDFERGRIMIWRKPPGSNGQPADVIIDLDEFNNRWSGKLEKLRSNLLPLALDNGQLALTGEKIYIWDRIPRKDNGAYDRILDSQNSRDRGGVWGSQLFQSRLYVADTFNNRILGYNIALPRDEAPVELLLGAKKISFNLFTTQRAFNNLSSVLSTGQSMIISSFRLRGAVYQSIPTKPNARLDTLISMFEWGEMGGEFRAQDPVGSPAGAWSDGKRLIWTDSLTGALMYYDSIPDQNHQWPDYYIVSATDSFFRLPKVNSNRGLNDVFVYEDQLFVTSTDGKKIYIWNAVPDGYTYEAPDVTIRTKGNAGGVVHDGKRLIVADSRRGVLVWNGVPTKKNQKPDLIIKGAPQAFKTPVDVAVGYDSLFVSDIGNHAVYIYNSFPSSPRQRYDAILGQDKSSSTSAGKSREKMMLPSWLSFDGEYLWVGEQQFSDRVLGFRTLTGKTRPSAPSVVKAQATSNNQISLQWSDNSDNESSFRIEYRAKGTSKYSVYANPVFNSEQFFINGLAADTEYEFKLSAVNSFGVSKSVSVSARTLNTDNNPPLEVVKLFPADDGDAQFFAFLNAFILRWGGRDTDSGDRLTYDLYLGTSDPPVLISQGQRQAMYSIRDVMFPSNTTFYWKVVATDSNGASTESELWSFTTGTFSDPGNALAVEQAVGGTTSLSPGTYTYSENRFFASRLKSFVVAVPATGYEFSGWSGDVPKSLKQSNPLVLPIDKPRTIKPVFTRIEK